MNWHYVENGQQTGPVNDEQLAELNRTGRINDNTLVWREGMANWLPLGQASLPPGQSGADASSSSLRISRSSEEAGQTTATCSECGQVFPVDEMIRHGSSRICANCKPVFMQKLAEGAKFNTGNLIYARVVTRFAAVFVDGIVLAVVGMVIKLIAGFGIAQAVGIQPPVMTPFVIVILLVQFAIGVGYEVFFIGKYGATLGKMLCKIKVVTADGGPVSYARALGRYFAKLVSALTCMIGYIMACFDSENRALHDRMCNTRVVTK